MALLWHDHEVQVSAALLGRSLGLLSLAALAMFVVRLCQVRMRFRRLIKQYDIPTLPHSPLFGHLILVAKALAPYPRDYIKTGLVYALNKRYPEVGAAGLTYLDTWPLGTEVTLAVFHPDMMAQCVQETSLPKSPMVSRELQPLTGGNDLVTMEAQEHRTWRSVFNPGFSAQNLTALLPAFLEEIQVLKEIFIEASRSGSVLNMEETVQKATVDLICRAVLGIRLHSQTRDTSFVKTMQNQIWWLTCDYSLANIIKENFPLRPFILWNNSRKMKKFLAPLIEDGIAKFDSSKLLGGAKTINYLAIKAYRSEVQEKASNAGKPQGVDPKFLDVAVAQLKIFIFAGHDTTASTLSFAYSRLYRDSARLAKVRAEHDQVLGTDPSQALSRLTENPNLLNQMPYTQAVVKEILRLYPPAATARLGTPDFFFRHPETGKLYPTDGMVVWNASYMSQRHPDYWPRADEFVPERWLAGEGEALHPRRNAWRPFELGPRNCIGQELAQLELRAILAMTLRELEFEPAYAEGAPEVFGEKAYHVMDVGDITGHIKDGFPVRVRMRSGMSEAS